MGLSIEDGRGRGNSALVNKRNHLGTDSITRSASHFASEHGRAFAFASSAVAITTANTEYCLAYIRNDSEDLDFVISIARVSSLANCIFRTYRNPTSVASATTATAVNLNFSSGKSFDGHWSSGKNGATLSGGAFFGQVLINGVNTLDVNDSVILSNGDVFAVTVRALTATSCGTTILGYFISQDEIS